MDLRGLLGLRLLADILSLACSGRAIVVVVGGFAGSLVGDALLWEVGLGESF
jgi:hypothetical protein